MSLSDKEAAMAKLCETQSDLISNTKAYCKSALPDKDSKRKIWDGLFGKEYDSLSLLDHEYLCSGLLHRHHSSLTQGFEEEFFERIEEAVATKSINFAQHLYYDLQPNQYTNDVDIKRFENFLEKIKSQKPGESTNRLTKWLKDSI